MKQPSTCPRYGLVTALILAVLAAASLFMGARTANAEPAATPGQQEDISFAFVDPKGSLSKDGQTPLAVIGFSKQVTSATLTLQDEDGSLPTYVDASSISDDAALFYLAAGTTQVSISEVYYTFADDPVTTYMLAIPGDEAGGQTSEASDADDQSTTDAQGADVAVQAYTLDENGEAQEVSIVGNNGIATFAANGSATNYSRGIKTIVIDAGHGGNDSGAVGYGLRECDLTLAIARACRDELATYGNARVIMTRDSDTTVDLMDRPKVAVNAGADLFVSIHINSEDSGSARGVEVWIPLEASWYPGFHELGQELSDKVLDKLVDLGLAYRGTKSDYYDYNGKQLYYPDGSRADAFAVIRGCREGGVLGILIEHGFISNQHDASLLSSANYLRQLGVADAQAIADQLGLIPGGLPLYGFSDVTADTPHSFEIGWLAASGISTGFGDGTFRGMDSVTRQDAAAFLYRMAGSPGYTPSAADRARFSDVTDATPHAKEIWWLASTGITTGFGDGTFRGMNTVARQDMAAFLRRFVSRFVDPAAANWSPSNAAGFSDVNSSTSHYEDILWLATTGVSTGYGDGTFRSMSNVARQDMAAFLYRANNLPSFAPSSEQKNAFSDVNDSTAHANEIWWLASAGISMGFADGTFKGGDAVTRQDAAAFLYRMAGSPTYTPSEADRSRFSDVTSDTPHAKEIWWLASVGISSGYGDGTFRGYSSITRQDMAAFLQRYYNAFSVNSQFKNWSPTASAMLRFLDVDSSTGQANSIWWLGATGISNGFSDGFFCPGDTVARQDMAAFLYRLNNLATRNTDSADSYYIMGSSSYTSQQLAALYKSTGRAYPSAVYASKGATTIDDFAAIVIDEANAEGVKPEVVFAQEMHETGWLQYGGDVKAEQCNFAGLGATGGGNPGLTFESVRMGVRAQVQHLKAYASTEPLKKECIDPRFKYVTRGTAPTLAKLDGHWAVPGNGYGNSIFSIIKQIPGA